MFRNVPCSWFYRRTLILYYIELSHLKHYLQPATKISLKYTRNSNSSLACWTGGFRPKRETRFPSVERDHERKARIKRESKKKKKKKIVSSYVLVLTLRACSTWSPVARAIVVKNLLARKGEGIFWKNLLISSSSDIKVSLPGQTDRLDSVEKECEGKIQ